MKFDPLSPPSVGDKLVKLYGDNAPSELYTVVNNDEYGMIGMVTVRDSKGHSSILSHDRFDYASEKLIAEFANKPIEPKRLKKMLKRLKRTDAVGGEDGEA